MTLILQCCYYFITGIWPLADMHTFETVTGPKTDDWIVKAFGAQILAVSIFLILAIYRNRLRTAGIIGILTASAIGIIETVFALKGSIHSVYLVDALIELMFISGTLSGIAIFHNSPRV